MKEIGSEFWTIDLDNSENNKELFNIGKDYKLFMSGRTSIDFILSDIEDKKKIVYMPNYSCESMVQPFKDNGYEVYYYFVDVINNKYDINVDFECSIFFAMSYFGYNCSNMDDYIKKFNKREIIVIEDITHRLLCDKNHCEKSTYLVASLRKWFPLISGGISINVNNSFKKNIKNYVIDKEFINLKEKAMNLKRDYINNKSNNKEEFLELYNKSNHMITNYKNKKMDNKSIKILEKLNINDIKNRRIKNCKIIEKKLKNNKNVVLLYKYKKGDCPLFVPIMVKNRDYIRKCLIDSNIYLPAHWPNNMDLNNEIYNLELSLINDQRYSEVEIDEYIEKLIKIVGE